MAYCDTSIGAVFCMCITQASAYVTDLIKVYCRNREGPDPLTVRTAGYHPAVSSRPLPVVFVVC